MSATMCRTIQPRSHRSVGRRPFLTRPQRGQGIAEMALILPVLLLVALGTVDFGRIFFDYIQLRGAVREGAGYGARFPKDIAGIEARVKAHGVPAGTNVSTDCKPNLSACTTVGGGGAIVVTATHTFTPIASVFLGSFGLGPVTMNVSATMRVMT